MMKMLMMLKKFKVVAAAIVHKVHHVGVACVAAFCDWRRTKVHAVVLVEVEVSGVEELETVLTHFVMLNSTTATAVHHIDLGVGGGGLVIDAVAERVQKVLYLVREARVHFSFDAADRLLMLVMVIDE